jgi:hypothetical protein
MMHHIQKLQVIVIAATQYTYECYAWPAGNRMHHALWHSCCFKHHTPNYCCAVQDSSYSNQQALQHCISTLTATADGSAPAFLTARVQQLPAALAAPGPQIPSAPFSTVIRANILTEWQC